VVATVGWRERVGSGGSMHATLQPSGEVAQQG
jgi:hypothetical protein